jgi:hypothetical protein
MPLVKSGCVSNFFEYQATKLPDDSRCVVDLLLLLLDEFHRRRCSHNCRKAVLERFGRIDDVLNHWRCCNACNITTWQWYDERCEDNSSIGSLQFSNATLSLKYNGTTRILHKTYSCIQLWPACNVPCLVCLCFENSTQQPDTPTVNFSHNRERSIPSWDAHPVAC